ncbi:putative ribonuclease H-like domain-containing protein [Tanacetum coccineum]
MIGNKFNLLNYQEINGGFVAFGRSPKGGKITGKGKIRTGELNFEDVYFVKELKFNLFSVSQMFDKKNSVLFTKTECLVLSPDFKLLVESQVLLKVPRQNNMYNFDLKNVVPSRGLPSKLFENDYTCVACQKGKQHKASYKTKIVSSICKPLQLLHMDLFGPVSIRSINKKTYCLVVTDDFSRFSWVFFFATKDKTPEILKNFITGIENQIDHKVKTIRCDNGTEFKNRIMNEFCKMKGIRMEFSVARTPQQNGVAERKNRTLIEAARTMLADYKLPTTFWAEAVNTACYVQNRVLVIKPHNKTPYEVFLDPLGKFDGKADEGFLVGYSINSKAFRVFNTRTRKVEENLHINFLGNKPNVVGSGPEWLFDIDSLTKSMNYEPVTAGNQTNKNAGIKNNVDAVPTQQYILLPLLYDSPQSSKDAVAADANEELAHEGERNGQEKEGGASNKENDQNNSIKDHPKDQIIGDINSATQTRRMTKISEEHAMVIQALIDPSWIEAIQEELLQFKLQKVWTLVDLPKGKRAIGTKWVYRNKGEIYYTGGMFNDIIFGSTKKFLCIEFEQMMHKRFQMSFMRELTFFLGLQVQQKEDGIFISQDKYVTDILKKFDFVTIKTASTLIHTNKALLKDEEAEDVDVHLYRSMVGSLMYLTASRPNIMFVVCACARFQVSPKVSHLHIVNRIFRNLKGQPKLGLRYPMDSPFDVEAFSNSDYAGAEPLTGNPQLRGCQFLGIRLISWQCKKQTRVANSTTEAEYVAAANCCGHVLWIQNQMLNYGFNFMNTKIHIDNERTICIVKNPVFYSKTKHIEIRHHFIRDSYEKKLIQVIKIYKQTKCCRSSPQRLLIDEFGVKTGSCKVNAARQDLVLLSERSGPRRQEYHVGVQIAQLGLRLHLQRSPRTQLSSKINTSRSGEDSMEHQVDLMGFVPPTSNDSPLSGGHTPRSDEELVIQKLKKKVKRLEKALRARTPGMKLFKIGTSRRKGLDKENVSQTRRKSDKRQMPMFNEIRLLDSMQAPRTNAPVKIRIVEEEPRRANTSTNKQTKTKLAQRLFEEEQAQFEKQQRIAREKAAEQEAKDVTLIKQMEDVQARMDADELLAERLQQQEREQFTVDEQARIIKKRPRAEHDEESIKKQKLEDEAEREELRACLDIVPGDDITMDFESFAIKYPIID